MQASLTSILQADEASVLRLVLDTVSDCLVVVDTDGRIVFINHPYCDLLGGTAEDFIDRHIRDVVSPASHLAEVAQGAEPRPSTRLTVRGREILTRQVPLLHNGEIVGALGMSLFTSANAAGAHAKGRGPQGLVINTTTSQWRTRYKLNDIVGCGPEMDALRAQVRRCAKNALPVWVHGETGTGKELVAQSVHQLSARSRQPFVWINCTTIPAELVSSELFGYEGGSFTGAAARGAKGKIETAEGGTLFLDEIGDMPLHAQASLLRFLQEGEITRVGGSRPIQVDVRLVCASHKNLKELVAQGLFREDLYYRLSVLRCEVPALRQRSDLHLLVSHLLDRIRNELGLARLAISRPAMAQLQAHLWPGNVRELIACLQRGAVALEEDQFEIGVLADLPRPSAPGMPASPHADAQATEPLPALSLHDAVNRAERDAVTQALKHCRGNRTKAAQRLGIDRASLYKRLRDWGWDTPALAPPSPTLVPADAASDAGPEPSWR